MDINDDIYRCSVHELELCVRACRRRDTLTHLCVYLPVCVCVRPWDSRVSFPQMLPLTFNPRAEVKPWQMRWSSSGQICKHSTTIFCPPPLLSSPHIRHSSPLHSSQCVSSTASRASQRMFSLHTNMFYCICCGNLKAHTPFKLRITALVKFNTSDICRVYRRKENKRVWSERRSCGKDLDITTVHFESTLCVFGKSVSDVKDEKCCSVVFYTCCWL